MTPGKNFPSPSPQAVDAAPRTAQGLPTRMQACLFDLDGVLTHTAKLHAAAWKEMYDGFLTARAERIGSAFVAVDEVGDYDTYVDGRAGGTRSLPRSRGIVLPTGASNCLGYRPAGTAAFHLGADIADAIVRYPTVNGDETFERDIGLELLAPTRLWHSLGHDVPAGRFRIDGVTGPDEYAAFRAHDLGVDAEEISAWRGATKAMVACYDDTLGVHSQAERSTSHELRDFDATSVGQYPLFLHVPCFNPYRKQVVKQADLVLAMHLRGDAFTAEEKARNFAYYEALTVRDSSLSACTQAVMAAETGHLELAYDYLTEAALMDLDNLEHNTRDGLHVASLAGTWIALVPGFAGLRESEGGIALSPRLPAGITRLALTICVRNSRLKVDITQAQTTYRVLDGAPLSLRHYVHPLTVAAGSPIEVPNPARSNDPAPRRPRGRAPQRHRAAP